MDPVDSSLKAHFLAQLARKYAQIPNFQGLVVDRSDWNSLYNYDYDDGASLVGNRTAHLSQYSYLDTIGALRQMMKEKQGVGQSLRLNTRSCGSPLTAAPVAPAQRNDEAQPDSYAAERPWLRTALAHEGL